MNKRKLLLANNPLLSGPKLHEREKGGIPYREILIDWIDADPNQPRREFDEERLQELAASIRQYGVLNPVLVKPSERAGRYTLIAGERRLRASKLAGLTSIPAIVDQEADEAGSRTLAIQLVENLQRSDLSALERAHAIGALKGAFGLSVRDVAERLGISKSMVQRSLDILTLPDDLLNALRQGASESKVLLLAKIEDEEIRATYLKDLELVTREELQKAVSGEEAPKPVETRGGERERFENPEDHRLADEIQRSLGLKVRLTRTSPTSPSGKLTIDFYSDQDLQEVFRKLIAEL